MIDVLITYAKWINGGADRCAKGYILPALTASTVEIPVGGTDLVGLDIFEFFYHGTDPGDCFHNFDRISTIYDDRKRVPIPI